MLEDLNITISILRKEKNLLISNLDKTDNIKEIDEILNNIFKIDIKINEYIKKIKEKDSLESCIIKEDSNISKEKRNNDNSIDNQSAKSIALKTQNDEKIDSETKKAT